jgi:hypothetical protein
MWNRRQVVPILSSFLLSAVLVSTGCNYWGEDAVREKDNFAVSSTVKTAIGAGGSTFIAPIMNNWITAYQQMHPGTLVNYRPVGSGAGLACPTYSRRPALEMRIPNACYRYTVTGIDASVQIGNGGSTYS